MGIPSPLGRPVGAAAGIGLLAALLLSTPSGGQADIYRFVTIDGVETFTDTPVNREARVVIKDPAKRQQKQQKKNASPKVHNISLNEVVARTVDASLNPQQTAEFTPRLPPVGGSITSGVGMRVDPIDGKWRQHNGIDIAIPEGTPVTPAAPGTVVYSGQRSGYGNTVLVEHGNGMITLYAHNSRLLVSAGQPVDFNTVIAISGNTGRSTGPHLHFEAWQAGSNITPAFLPGGTMPAGMQVASYKTRTQFRKQIMSDGSMLITNVP